MQTWPKVHSGNLQMEKDALPQVLMKVHLPLLCSKGCSITSNQLHVLYQKKQAGGFDCTVEPKIAKEHQHFFYCLKGLTKERTIGLVGLQVFYELHQSELLHAGGHWQPAQRPQLTVRALRSGKN